MNYKKVALPAIAVLAMGVSLLLAPDSFGADAKKPAKPEPKASVVSQIDVTKPGDATEYVVWRNGRMHKVKVKIRTYVVTHADGTKGTSVVEEGGAVEDDGTGALLAPEDPAFADVKPTEAQVAEAMASIGADRPPAPPTP